MNKPRTAVIVAIILAAAAVRLIPHPPSFTPITAIALFGGAGLASKRAGLLVPLGAMFLSDIILGLSWITPVVYASIALITCLGFWLRRRPTLFRLAAVTLATPVQFFVITNFGVWVLSSLYPKTGSGLAACYVAAIPFFRNMLVSNLLFVVLIFGGFALAKKRWVFLAETAPVTA